MYSLIEQWPNSDRAIHYGDGVFTTMKSIGGRVELKPLHIARLQRDAKRIGLPDVDIDLATIIDDFAQIHPNNVIKLILSSGSGGRGYGRPNTINPNVYLAAYELPTHYAQWQHQGISLAVSAVSLARQPLLAGVKHLNRLEQVMIKHAMTDEADDVIVCDTNENIVEASSGNVFWYKGNSWHTPSLHYCGVNGVKRQQVMEYLLDGGENVNVCEQKVDELYESQAMFLCNAVMGIVAVKNLNLKDKTLNFDINPVIQLSEKVAQWQQAL